MCSPAPSPFSRRGGRNVSGSMHGIKKNGKTPPGHSFAESEQKAFLEGRN
jgi:hypothetical protein